MIDYSEGMLNLNKKLKECEKAQLKNDDEKAVKLLKEMESECRRVRNWYWRNK